MKKNTQVKGTKNSLRIYFAASFFILLLLSVFFLLSALKSNKFIGFGNNCAAPFTKNPGEECICINECRKNLQCDYKINESKRLCTAVLSDYDKS